MPLLTMMVAVLVLRERFSVIAVRATATIVHQGRLVLGELQSAAYVQRAQSLTQMQQIVKIAPREAFSPKLVRRLVSSALKELSSPPMGNLHVSPAPPGKSAFLVPRNASHAQKVHFLMKPLEVASHVTTT